MSIYGDSIFENRLVISESDLNIIAEYFKQNPDAIVLDEAHWSKKELQDPETFKKLLTKFDKEKSIKGKIDNIWCTLSIADGILAGVLTKRISIGIVTTIAAFVGKCFIIMKTDEVLKNSQGNRIKQLREKAVKLRDKAAQLDDPESKKVVENCNKLIKEIDKYIEKQEKAEYKKKYNEVKEIYTNMINAINGKYGIDFPGDFETIIIYKYAITLKIDPKRIDEGIKKCALDHEETLWGLWFGYNTKEEILKDTAINYLFEDTINVLGKYIPEFKTNNSIILYNAIDDTVFFYSPKANKFYYGDYWFDDKKYIESDITKYLISNNVYEKWVKSHINDYDIDMDLLKAVDADLGYYRLTPPPEGVKPKKI